MKYLKYSMLEVDINRGRGNINEVKKTITKQTSFSSGFRFFLIFNP